MDENLSLEYTAPTDLAKGYHYLGRASVSRKGEKKTELQYVEICRVLMTAVS